MAAMIWPQVILFTQLLRNQLLRKAILILACVLIWEYVVCGSPKWRHALFDISVIDNDAQQCTCTPAVAVKLWKRRVYILLGSVRYVREASFKSFVQLVMVVYCNISISIICLLVWLLNGNNLKLPLRF